MFLAAELLDHRLHAPSALLNIVQLVPKVPTYFSGSFPLYPHPHLPISDHRGLLSAPLAHVLPYHGGFASAIFSAENASPTPAWLRPPLSSELSSLPYLEQLP